MIKIAFEEDKINMALMLLNQIRVEGVLQAGMIVPTIRISANTSMTRMQ